MRKVMSNLRIITLLLVVAVPAIAKDKKNKNEVTEEQQHFVSWLSENPMKIYIESDEPVDASPRNYFDKQALKIISRPEIAQRMANQCALPGGGTLCQVTIKKESADYVVMFAAGQGSNSRNWSWVVFENNDGIQIRNGQTVFFDNAVKDALVASGEHLYAKYKQEKPPNEYEKLRDKYAPPPKPAEEKREQPEKPTGGAHLQEYLDQFQPTASKGVR
jgi:hypothetical protein